MRAGRPVEGASEEEWAQVVRSPAPERLALTGVPNLMMLPSGSMRTPSCCPHSAEPPVVRERGAQVADGENRCDSTQVPTISNDNSDNTKSQRNTSPCPGLIPAPAHPAVQTISLPSRTTRH